MSPSNQQVRRINDSRAAYRDNVLGVLLSHLRDIREREEGKRGREEEREKPDTNLRLLPKVHGYQRLAPIISGAASFPRKQDPWRVGQNFFSPSRIKHGRIRMAGSLHSQSIVGTVVRSDRTLATPP